jgi:hypothetical protein
MPHELKPHLELLHRELCAAGLRPSRAHVHVNGKITWTWHIDDDDDRYVQATDSLYSDQVVLLARDGHLGGVEATVLSDPHEIVDWVWERLNTMGASSSPRGRRPEPGSHAPPEGRDEP